MIEEKVESEDAKFDQAKELDAAKK